jgi:hypothetical protein
LGHKHPYALAGVTDGHAPRRPIAMAAILRLRMAAHRGQQIVLALTSQESFSFRVSVSRLKVTY